MTLIRGRIDPATGVFTPHARPPTKANRESRPVDPETAAHEARHAAVALIGGVRVTEARADYPSPDTAGHVLFAADTDPRKKALMMLAGEMGHRPDWPPDWPSRSGPAECDEHRLAELVDVLDLDRRGYGALCDEAKNLVDSPGVADLASMLEMFLAKGYVLNEDKLAIFYNALCPPRSGVMAKFDTATLHRKSFTASADAKASGEFTALVAVFNNIDKGGDRIVPGAFTKTLAQWRASGDPVPVIWSHEWGQPDSHIGVAYAKDMQETDRGLLVRTGQLDIDDNPVARRVHKLMARRSVKEFSFGYSVAPGGERKASDGANELLELDLVEIGPTLKGMNPPPSCAG